MFCGPESLVKNRRVDNCAIRQTGRPRGRESRYVESRQKNGSFKKIKEQLFLGAFCISQRGISRWKSPESRPDLQGRMKATMDSLPSKDAVLTNWTSAQFYDGDRDEIGDFRGLTDALDCL